LESIPVSNTAPPTANHFNLVRLWLALAVIFSHCFELIDRGRMHEPLYKLTGGFTTGDLAVDGFFVLSGFLILQSWRSDPKPTRYLVRRALRIYPAFLVATLICGLVLGPVFGGGTAYFEQFTPGKFVLAALTLREPAVPPVFIGSPYTDVNGSVWTIQYEFMCYLLVILGGIAIANCRPFWWAVFVCTLGLGLLFPEAMVTIHFPGSRFLLGDEPLSFVRFLTFFAAGALWQLHSPRIPFNVPKVALTSLIAFVSLFQTKLAALVLPIAAGYAILAVASRPSADTFMQRYIRRNDFSYGVYLAGWPVQQLWIHWLHLKSPWGLLPIAAASAIAYAALSWHWIERPTLRWKPGKRMALTPRVA